MFAAVTAAAVAAAEAPSGPSASSHASATGESATALPDWFHDHRASAEGADEQSWWSFGNHLYESNDFGE